MSNGKIIVCLTILFFLLSVNINGCSSVSNTDSAINKLENSGKISEQQAELIADLLGKFPDNTQFAISLINDTAVQHYGALRDHNILKAIENHNFVFEIGSVTKVFTSSVLAHLILEGKADPDRPIHEFIGLPINGSPAFTLLQLSNHTSGLPRIPSGYLFNFLFNINNPYKNFDDGTIMDYLENKLELENEPGVVYNYSNIGAGLLGFFLSRMEQKSYEELLQETVFVPLQMHSTTTNRARIEDQLVKGLTKRGKEAKNWDLAALAGAGAVLSTTEDMARFVLANFDAENEALALQRESTFQINDRKETGMGWIILSRDNGYRLHWHNGGTGGYRSSIVIDTENKAGVVVLSNISAGHKFAGEIDSLSFRLLESIYAVETGE